MNDKYILDENNNPVICYDTIKWAESMEDSRRVALDYINEVKISTVFLDIDHDLGYGIPILYETMIFGGEHDLYQERYSTREEALIGHEKAIQLIKDSQ